MVTRVGSQIHPKLQYSHKFDFPIKKIIFLLVVSSSVFNPHAILVRILYTSYRPLNGI